MVNDPDFLISDTARDAISSKMKLAVPERMNFLPDWTESRDGRGDQNSRKNIRQNEDSKGGKGKYRSKEKIGEGLIFELVLEPTSRFPDDS
jgi:hypothetical protein